MPSQRSVPFTATPWKVPEDRAINCGPKEINFRSSRTNIALWPTRRAVRHWRDSTGASVGTILGACHVRDVWRCGRCGAYGYIHWAGQGAGVIGRPKRMGIEAIVTSGDTRANKLGLVSSNCWTSCARLGVLHFHIMISKMISLDH
jgi:hypothetical protein